MISPPNLSPELEQLLEELHDIMTDDLPSKLPLMREIQHVIDLVLNSYLPNLPCYKPRVVLTLLAPKKEGT